MANYYQYPHTLQSKEEAGQHYLLIDSYESKNALASGDTVLSSIALYIPPNSLQYSHGANYEGLDQGALFGAAGAKVREVVEGGGGLKGIVAAALGGGSQENA